jgi:glycine/D-amino acid oxidase-like deaminating enzyme
VTVIEASAPGHGGSGRNGGQVIPGLRHEPDELIAVYGERLGRRLHAFGSGDADATFALIARLGLECGARRGGWIQAAENASDLRNADLRVKGWGARGAPVERLDANAFHALTGAQGYVGGWIDRRGGSVQPLSYARELARAAMAAGARLYIESPAVDFAPRGGGWRVRTPQGHVDARRLLLATNALTGALAPRVARSQLTVWSFQIASRVLNADEQARFLPTRAVVSDTRRVLRYFQRDASGRIVVGGKGTLGAPNGPASFALQRHTLAKLYPELADGGFDHAWGGQIAITLDRLPRLFRLGEGAYAVLQDNGKGIAWCTAMGAPLAELMAGADPDTLPLVPVTEPQPIPLQRFRKAYVTAGNTWLRFLDLTDRLR